MTQQFGLDAFREIVSSLDGGQVAEAPPTFSSGAPRAVQMEDDHFRSQLERHGISYSMASKPDKVIYKVQCPYTADHSASFIRFLNNSHWIFKCFHASCPGRSNNSYAKAMAKLLGSDAVGESDPSDPIEAAVQKLNERHAAVMLNGKFAIMNEGYNRTTEVWDVNFSSVADFHNAYKNMQVVVPCANGKGVKYLPATKIWMESENRRQYEGVIFSPNCDVDGFYNLWRGFAVEPRQGNWDLMRQHIFEVIANGDQATADYVSAFLADGVQNPGGPRPGIALALRGHQGTGKGTLVNHYGPLFGDHFISVADPGQLTGRFNDHLKGKVIVYADEAVFGGDKVAAGKLKSMVTEPTLTIEPKGLNSFSVHNHVRLILSSNNDWVVPAGPRERRFMVLDVSDCRIGDFKYFRAINDQMDNGGREAMLYDLLNYNLTGVNLREFPRTLALLEQINASMSPFQKFWYDRLSTGELFNGFDDYPAGEAPHRKINYYDNPWPDEAAVQDLHSELIEYCQKLNIRHRPTDKQMGMELKKVCSSCKRVRSSKGHRPWVYRLPQLSDCRELFEKFFGVPIPWDE